MRSMSCMCQSFLFWAILAISGASEALVAQETAAPAPSSAGLACFVVPSHWIGQENPSSGGSYRIELEFRSGPEQPIARYLGPDSNWHGPYDVTVDQENEELSFVDGPTNSSTWILRCASANSLTGELEQANQGTQAIPTATISFTSTPPAQPLDRCFATPSRWTGQQNTSSGSYPIKLEFKRKSGRPIVRYFGADSRWHGPYDLTVDKQNRELLFTDGPQNPTRWRLHCGQGVSLEGGTEQERQGQLTTPTGKVSFSRQ